MTSADTFQVPTVLPALRHATSAGTFHVLALGLGSLIFPSLDYRNLFSQLSSAKSRSIYPITCDNRVAATGRNYSSYCAADATPVTYLYTPLYASVYTLLYAFLYTPLSRTKIVSSASLRISVICCDVTAISLGRGHFLLFSRD